MARNSFKRGSKERFVMLGHGLLETAAYRSLGLGGRCLLVELIKLFTGTNNGQIYLPTREAAERLGCNRNTVGSYYRDLEKQGFIRPTEHFQLGLEGKGRSWKWRLTHQPYNGKAPTRDFANLKPLPENLATPAKKTGQARAQVMMKTTKVAGKPSQAKGKPLLENLANIYIYHGVQHSKGSKGKVLHLGKRFYSKNAAGS